MFSGGSGSSAQKGLIQRHQVGHFIDFAQEPVGTHCAAKHVYCMVAVSLSAPSASVNTPKRPCMITQNPANGTVSSLRPIINGYCTLENASRLPFGSLRSALTRSPACSYALDTGEGRDRRRRDFRAAQLPARCPSAHIHMAGFWVIMHGRIPSDH
jgi:hypothetical protein